MYGSKIFLFILLQIVCEGHEYVQAATRTYYLAAVEEDWDYAPGGNLVNDDLQ